MPYVPGGAMMPPAVDAQRNNITQALMNIAHPPPRTAMPNAPGMPGQTLPPIPQPGAAPTPGAPIGAGMPPMPSPLPQGAPPALPGMPPPTMPLASGVPPQGAGGPPQAPAPVPAPGLGSPPPYPGG